ncbi:MAG: protein translocase subunit SecF [Magnetococcus sp. DMHC-6]
MELIQKTYFNFIEWRKMAFVLSGLLIVASIISLVYQGLNFGIDFSGGTLIQLRFKQPAPVHEIRTELAKMDLGDVVIQEFGSANEILIRLEKQEVDPQKQSKMAQELVEHIRPLPGGADLELRRVEYVGPQVGQELTTKGLLAVLYSIIAILIYVAWRFEFRFALGAVLALVHDVIITVGYFSIMQKEFTLVVVAAVLTVIGYSINDTIVVFDRIREEMKRMKKQPLDLIINTAINETLSRTIITSLTVVLVLVALLLFGGEVIFDFALALFLGIVVGTYSSIFIASPIVYLFEKKTIPQP